MDKPPTFSPNPYANFDPSQWSNPYSLFQKQALPFPTSYVGAPYDAYGQPIASYPVQVAAAQARLAQAAGATPGTTLNSTPNLPALNYQGMAYQSPQAQSAPAAQAAPMNNWDLAMSSLAAGPDFHMQTPGATVPQSSPFQPGPGVLQNFLAGWSPATSGPGSQFQQIFNQALRGK